MTRLLARVFFFFCVVATFTATNFARASVKFQESNFEAESIPGEFIVRLKDDSFFAEMTEGQEADRLRQLSEELGSSIKSTIPGQNIVVIKRPVFELTQSVIKILSQNELVDIIEPNYIYHMNRVPNDPMLGSLWGMMNRGQADSKKTLGISGVDIGAEQAWDIETGSKDVLVAVIDTGIGYNNPDLKDNVWTNKAEANGITGVDDDQNGYVDDVHGYNFVSNTGDPLDDQGHGSHCSGTIGAKGNDGKGIVGVAWDVKIMGVKFLDAKGSGSLDNALKAIDYATKNGARIMSNSWGGGGASVAMKDAILRSHAAGALFVAAAGNDGRDNDASPSYPASYDVPNVLAVAAVGNRGELASFSNYGKKLVHVAAPGVNITSSTTTGYESWSGTSMATPHVSGIAVLLASHEPHLTNIELRERIIATAKPLPGLRGKVSSGGMANAFTALTNTRPMPDANDPANWQTKNVSVSSAHPYRDRTSEEFEVRVPGTKQISLFFSKFDTERGYDVASFFDSAGNKIGTMSGANDDSFSDVIEGDYVKIVFTSDPSVSRYGFDISKVAYR